jgi:hypothetical protein
MELTRQLQRVYTSMILSTSSVEIRGTIGWIIVGPVPVTMDLGFKHASLWDRAWTLSLVYAAFLLLAMVAFKLLHTASQYCSMPLDCALSKWYRATSRAYSVLMMLGLLRDTGLRVFDTLSTVLE